MVGRPLLVTEGRAPLLERLLLTATWAMRRLSRYTLWVAVTIRTPHAAEAACAQAGILPLRLQAQLVELSSYGCAFASGEGAWTLQGEIARLPYPPPAGEEPLP